MSKFLKYLLICFSPSGEERSSQGLRMASPSVPMVKKIIESKWSMQRLTGWGGSAPQKVARVVRSVLYAAGSLAFKSFK